MTLDPLRFPGAIKAAIINISVSIMARMTMCNVRGVTSSENYRPAFQFPLAVRRVVAYFDALFSFYRLLVLCQHSDPGHFQP